MATTRLSPQAREVHREGCSFRIEEQYPDGRSAKAFHLVLNKYHRNDGIDLHQDRSPTYHGRNPITSLSYGGGSSLTITDSTKPSKQMA